MSVNRNRARCIQAWRDVRRASPENIADAQHALMQKRFGEGVSVLALVREISAAYEERAFSRERKTAAILLIGACSEHGRLQRLASCWHTDERRSVDRGHRFAIALLEGVSMIVSRAAEMRSWYPLLIRLIHQLSAYAQHGFISDEKARSNVRQNSSYGNALVRCCRTLVQTLEAQERTNKDGRCSITVSHLKRIIFLVEEQLGAAKERDERTKKASVALETVRLAQKYGCIPVLTGAGSPSTVLAPKKTTKPNTLS